MALLSNHRLISGTASLFGYINTGFSTQYNFGSISPPTVPGNYNIKELRFNGVNSIQLTIEGIHTKEGLFHTLHIGSNLLTSASSNFTLDGGNNQCIWTWSGYTGALFEPYLEIYVYFSTDGDLGFNDYGVELYNDVGRTVLTFDSKVSFFKGYFSGSVPANTPYFAVTVPGLVSTDRILNLDWSKTAWIVEGTGYTSISTSNNTSLPQPYGFLVISNGE